MRRVLLSCVVVASAWGCSSDSSPPTIADLSYFPDTVAAIHARRTVSISGSLRVQGGVSALHVRAASWELAIPLDGAGGATSGIISGSFDFDVPPGPGTYPFDVWVTDSDGQASNTLRGQLAVVPDSSCTRWTRIGAGPTSSAARAVLWTGTRFVVLGEDLQFLTSEDAVTWTSLPSTMSFRALASSGAMLVAVGPACAIATSPDGLDWTPRACPAADADLEAVAWAGDRFVALGGRIASTDGWHNPVVLTSTDGVTWTAHALELPSQRFRSVAWSGTRLVAGTESDSGTATQILASDDGGGSWVSSEVMNSSYAVLSMSWIGSEFLAIRRDSALLRSADGLSWSGGWVPMQFVNAATWTGDHLVAVGFGIGTGGLGPDGSPWTNPISGFADEGGWLRGGLRGVAWSGLQCVAIGDGIVLTSP